MKCKYCPKPKRRDSPMCHACTRQKQRGHICHVCWGPYYPSKRGCLYCIKIKGPVTHECRACRGNNFETGGWSYTNLCGCCERRAIREGWCECGKAKFKWGCSNCKEPGDIRVFIIAPDGREKGLWMKKDAPINGNNSDQIGDYPRRGCWLVFRVSMRDWLSGRVTTPPKRQVKCCECKKRFMRRQSKGPRRPDNYCKECSRKRKNKQRIARRRRAAIPRGRTCNSCERKDTEVAFRWSEAECWSCCALAYKNGRCVVCSYAIFADGTCRVCARKELRRGTPVAKNILEHR